jgi:hypothetical protein
MAISFLISVSGRVVENEYPIEIGIRPERESIIWRQKVQTGDVQVAYLETDLILSHEAIQVTDCFSDTAVEIDSITYSTKAMSLLSEKDNLIFTTITGQVGSNESPMFYGHRLPKNITGVSFIPWNKSSDPYIAFYNPSYNLVASDFANRVDIEADSYNSSYVQYTNSSGIFSEIYKKEPVFKEAEIYDLIDEDGNLISNFAPRPIYTKTKDRNKWLYEFYKKTDDTIYYKEELDTSPQVKAPRNLSLEFPWELEIMGQGLNYEKIGETNETFFYNLQGNKVVSYYPSYPYVLNKKEAVRVNNNTFMVPNGKIEINKSKNVHLTYKVFRDDFLVFAETTKPSLVGKRITGSYVNKNIIRYSEFTGNYDPENGIIVINGQPPILAKDRISVEFQTKEKVSYRQLGNLNPLQNKKMLTGVLFYYVTPETEESVSNVRWLHLEEIYNVETESFILKLRDAEDIALQAYVGDTFTNIVNTYFVFDPYTRTDLSNSYNWMPLAFIKFNKQKYIDKVKHKDLRIFADVKNDQILDGRGRDFLFSNLLNKSGQVAVALEHQAIVSIDRNEIPRYSDFNDASNPDTITRERLAGIINSNLAADITSIHRHIDSPIIKKITMKRVGVNQYRVYVTIKKNRSIYEQISLYQALDNDYYGTSDLIVSDATLAEETQLENGDTFITFIIGAESSTHIKEKTNIYFYTKLLSSDGSVASPFSQIACVYCK